MKLFTLKTGIILKVTFLVALIINLVFGKRAPFYNFINITVMVFTVIVLLLDIYDYRKSKS